MNFARLIRIEHAKPQVVRLWRFVRQVACRFGEDRCSRVAGALAFATILSLVPLTVVALGIFSVFPVFESWMVTIQDFVYGNFVPTSGEAVQKYIEQFTRATGRLTIFSMLFLAITSIMVMATIEQVFNDIWRVRQRRKPLHRFLTYWAILTLTPLLIGASLSLTSQLFSLPQFGGQGVLRGVRGLVLRSLPIAFEMLAFLLLYTLVPNVSVKWRHALVGSVCAVLLFETTKHGFAYYVTQVPTYQTVYGTVAALPIFLIWVYLSWLVILLGAVVAANLGGKERDRS